MSISKKVRRKQQSLSWQAALIKLLDSLTELIMSVNDVAGDVLEEYNEERKRYKK